MNTTRRTRIRRSVAESDRNSGYESSSISDDRQIGQTCRRQLSEGRRLEVGWMIISISFLWRKEEARYRREDMHEDCRKIENSDQQDIASKTT